MDFYFYTLLDLRNLNLPQDNEVVKETIELVLQNGKADDGGIPLGPSTSQHSDVCANGMFLNYASYFKTPEKKLHSIIDSILNEISRMKDLTAGQQEVELNTVLCTLHYQYLKGSLNSKMQGTRIEWIESKVSK